MVWAGWDPPDVLISASDDLIHWDTPTTIAVSAQGGRAWYATVIGESDKVAGQEARLYYADIAPDFSSRQFISRRITFQRAD